MAGPLLDIGALTSDNLKAYRRDPTVTGIARLAGRSEPFQRKETVAGDDPLTKGGGQMLLPPRRTFGRAHDQLPFHTGAHGVVSKQAATQGLRHEIR